MLLYSELMSQSKRMILAGERGQMTPNECAGKPLSPVDAYEVSNSFDRFGTTPCWNFRVLPS